MSWRRIEETRCKNGIIVSTVFLGFHGLPDGDYETALKTREGNIDVVERYETEADAILGHGRYVLRNGGKALFD